MTTTTLYTCDCCGKQQSDSAQFNFGPGNSLFDVWEQGQYGVSTLSYRGKANHYCRSCIDKLNEAINNVFTENSREEVSD